MRQDSHGPEKIGHARQTPRSTQRQAVKTGGRAPEFRHPPTYAARTGIPLLDWP